LRAIRSRRDTTSSIRVGNRSELMLMSKHFVARLWIAIIVIAVAPAAVQAQAPDRPAVLHGSLGVPVNETGDFTQPASVPISDEVMSHESRYQSPTGLFMDGGAGYLFSRRFGAGVAFSRQGGSKPAAYTLT